jgi:hypothetical protein
VSADGGFQLPVVQARPAGAPATTRDAGWERAARWAVLLSWASLVYMAIEGGVGVWQGLTAGSVALAGWGLASFIEGLASVVVVWRFTGERRLSDTAEHRAQRLVAMQFFILAPYVTVESVRTLFDGGHADVAAIGMALTATSVVLCRCSARPSTSSPHGSTPVPRPVREPRTCCAASRPPPCWSDWPPTPRSAPGGLIR